MMSVTDPTIDPVTGLPILDTSGIVQQIPLGRQIVDYTGWNATAQPTRGPIFPDDGIPVFANVQGQHPTTGNAQNVTTDGEGRLNVHTYPSGGGGGLSPLPYKVGGAVHSGAAFGSTINYGITHTLPFTLYGFTLTMSLNIENIFSFPAYIWLITALIGNTTSHTVDVNTVSTHLSASTSATADIPIQDRLWIPAGWTVDSTNFPGDTTVHLASTIQNADAYITFLYWYI